MPIPSKNSYRPPSRLLRISATASLLIPLLGFSLPHWMWALGIPFGTSWEAVDGLQGVKTSLWLLGGVIAACGLLAFGLSCKWGQTFPAWMPLLGKRPVPMLVALLPGIAAALFLIWIGGQMVGCVGGALAGITGSCRGASATDLSREWAYSGTYMIFLAWGIAVGIASFEYYRLRRKR